jgi:exopolysaccharide biosynthesis polyprenyl glycosylphosphotransferase
VVLVDVAGIAAGMTLAYFIRPLLFDPSTVGAVHYARTGALVVPLWIAAFVHYRLYQHRHITSRLHEFKRLVHGVAAGGLVTGYGSFIVKSPVPRGWPFLLVSTTLLSLCATRELTRRIFDKRRTSGRLRRRIVIVGSGPEALALCDMLTAERVLGYDVVGFVDDHPLPDPHGTGYPPRIGDLAEVVGVMMRHGASGAIIAATGIGAQMCNRLARQLTEAGLHVEISSSLKDIAAERLSLRPLGRHPMMYLEPVHFGGWRAMAKWTFDKAVALGGLVLVAPLLVAIAIAVKVDSRGPVLFQQTRIGRGGKPFRVLKFRTMVPDAAAMMADLKDRNEADGPLFKLRDDPRITRTGRWLRRLSLDELPQLWNVVRNDMSLVGPRPAIPAEVEQWAAPLHRRLRVKPGLTGLWQVNGRSNASFDDYVRFDLYYVENWSFWVDVAIIW